MARGDFPSAKQDQFVLRFPDGMRDRIKEAAEDNSRSMNAEIIDRLEVSFDPLITNVRNTGDFYGELDKIVQRTIRIVQEEDRVAHAVPGDEKLTSEIVRALAKFMREGETPRAEAIRMILTEWLTEHGYMPPKDGAA